MSLFRQRGPMDVYPGTHRPVGTAHPSVWSETITGWDEDPIYKKVAGYYREFFGIAHLSRALGRSAKTIYKWEDAGLFPGATFVYNSASKQGRRRLYSRAQIEGVVAIATEEGVMDRRKRFLSQTLFPLRCADLFTATRTALPEPIHDWTPDA